MHSTLLPEGFLEKSVFRKTNKLLIWTLMSWSREELLHNKGVGGFRPCKNNDSPSDFPTFSLSEKLKYVLRQEGQGAVNSPMFSSQVQFSDSEANPSWPPHALSTPIYIPCWSCHFSCLSRTESLDICLHKRSPHHLLVSWQLRWAKNISEA